MTNYSAHAPGTFSWADLATTDPIAARRFYGEVLGVSFVDEGMGPEGTYTRLQQGGRDVAGLYAMLPPQRARGVPPSWLAYVTVADVDAAARRTTELGGRVLLAPQGAHDKGRMAVVVDPTGAQLGLWQARASVGAGVMHAPGTLTWAELLSTDVARATEFLCGLFGWAARAVDAANGAYTLLATAQGPTAGALQIPAAWGGMPSQWRVYFAVDDCDAAVARVVRHGGALCSGPLEVANVGRFAMCADPQGAVFEVLQAAARG
jgi:predicted enzyme related to lactoylglutathione lyase